MKAIKIPNTALLDVFGRPVSINSQDFHRLSRTDYLEKNIANNHSELNGQIPNGTVTNITPDNAQQLTVIGWLLLKFKQDK